MKNQIELRGNWQEIKEQLKKKFEELTDDDLLLIEGRQSAMITKIQNRLGKSLKEVQLMIREIEIEIQKTSFDKPIH